MGSCALVPPTFGERGLDKAYILKLVSRINVRRAGCDIDLLLLLRAYLTAELPEELMRVVRDCVLGFRFNFYAQGNDQLTTWTENRQLTFSVAQFISAQTFAGERFTDSRLAEEHLLAAASRIQVWLSDRFRFGFSEWLSPAPMSRCVGALTMLVDHSNNESIRKRSEMVLDLLILDAALHSFEGNLAVACARAEDEYLLRPQNSPMAAVMASAFGTSDVEVDLGKISSVFITRMRYRVPEAIAYIGTHEEERRTEISQGLNVDEVLGELKRHPDYPRTSKLDIARFWWGMQAIVNRRSIKHSMLLARGIKVRGNRILRPIKAFSWLPKFAVTSVQHLMNPFMAGKAIQRGNVTTFATRNYQLSSAQRYRPGEFGGEQHLWHARLRGGVNVFGNHPAAKSKGRKFISRWADNGINPDLAQQGNVLLGIQDLRGRHGFMEGKRKYYTHFHFPFVQFDQARIGPHWVAGRKGNAFIGILGTNNFEQVGGDEFVQRGILTGYVVVLVDEEEFGSLAEFIRHLRSYQIELTDGTLWLSTPFADYSLTWRGAFTFNGRDFDTDYDRYNCGSVATARLPRRIEVAAGAHKLVLDWDRLERFDT